MAAFAWDPEDYKKSSSIQTKWALELIEKLNLRGDEHVLDIGSGDGKVSAEIANRVPAGSVLGIDNSGDMVSHAKESFPRDKYPNLDFTQCDASELNFSDAFDIVFSNAALHWVKDQRPVLRGIRQSLKKGGRILLQMGGSGNAQGIFDVVGQIIRSEKWMEYFRDFVFPWGFYGTEEYRAWLIEAGLVPRRVELLYKEMVQQDKESFASWLRTTWLPYTQRIPDRLRDEFVRELVDNYTSKYQLDEKGCVHANMYRLEVEAERRD